MYLNHLIKILTIWKQFLIEMHSTYSTRPISDTDMDFLLDLYATTRTDIHQLTDWTTAQKSSFIKMQFDAQHLHYQTHFPNAKFNIILDQNHKSIGRYYICHSATEVRVIDITILPTHQQKGIGSSIINETMNQCRVAGLPLRLHVTKYNPALSWYSQLGFKEIDETDFTFHLEWNPTLIQYASPRLVEIRQ